MARHLFPGNQFWQTLAGSPAPVAVAPFAPFSVWTARTGGTDVSADLLDTDGITPLPIDTGTSLPMANALGERPAFLGPETLSGVEVVQLWVQTAVGARHLVNGQDREKIVLEAGANIFPISSITGLQTAIDNAGGGGAGTVTSVAGHAPDGSGNVALTATDIGLGNVVNLAPQNYPLSNAEAAALALKADNLEISTVNATNTTSSAIGLVSGRRIFEAEVAFTLAYNRVRLFYNGTTWPALASVPTSYTATGKIDWDSGDYLGAPSPAEARNGDRWLQRTS